MSIADCPLCKELVEAAELSIRKHLEATTELTSAVQKGASENAVSALRVRLQARSLDRENAVAIYERHQAGHGVKTMTAGSPSGG
jgi:hypothetical protein